MPASSWVRPLLGAAATIGGGLLTGRSQQKQSERQWELLEAEMRRRNLMQGMIAPQLLHAAGIRNPQQVARYTEQIRGGPEMPTAGGAPPPPTPSSGVSKGLNIAGTGLGLAGALGTAGLLGKGAGAIGSLNPATGALVGAGAKAGGLTGALGLGGGSGLLGLGAATIPVVGGAIAGGALLASQIGKGRRTADLLTDPERGAEGRLVALLQNPQASPDDLKSAYQNYLQTIEAFRSQGGNHRKVAEQSLANTGLQDTIRRRLAELGG